VCGVIGRVYTFDELEQFAVPETTVAPKTNGSRLAFGAVVPEGQRSAFLTSEGGRLRRTGLDFGPLLAALRALNTERCRPELSDTKVEGIARSLVRYPPAPEEPPWPSDEHAPHLRAVPDPMADAVTEAPVRDAPEPFAFSGEALLDLLNRVEPNPVDAGIPPPGHFTVEVAPPFTGKTSKLLWNLMARAAGVAPWNGAAALGPDHVLLLSPDESAEQVVRRMAQLARRHPAGRIDPYAERLHVLGPDRTLGPEDLDWLRFTPKSLARLDGWLSSAKAAGRPYAMVGLDAYADFLPDGVTENENGEATRIGGALERMAVGHGCAIVALAHTGKPPKDAPADGVNIRFLIRGASAIAAKARCIFSIESVPEVSNVRRIRTITNLARTPKSITLEVCDDADDDGAITHFRLAEAPKLTDVRPEQFLAPGEEIATNELARRLTPKGRRQTGTETNLATHLRETWKHEKLVVVRDGPRNAKLISLAAPRPSSEEVCDDPALL
jgi:hypothetical protein